MLKRYLCVLFPLFLNQINFYFHVGLVVQRGGRRLPALRLEVVHLWLDQG